MATLQNIIDRLKADLDVEDQINPFVSETDLIRFINSAIREAESEIHNIFEDYFLSEEDLNMVNGGSFIALPSDMFANKIRALIYNPTDQNQRYEIKPIRRLEEIQYIDSQDDYRYKIFNDADLTSGVAMIRLYPPARETTADVIKCYYLRNATQFATDGTENANTVDIPEFEAFLEAHAKVKVYEKDGDPRMQEAKEDRERQRKIMIESLTRMAADNNTYVLKDTTFYDDFTSPCNFWDE